MTIGYMLAGMLALTLLNVPIAVALGLVAIAAIVLIQGSFMLPNVALTMFQGASSFPLLAIPLFILAGGIMNASSISRRLVAFASALLGFIRGGLSFVTIGASMFFAEISGSAVAGVAALGSILIPAMRRKDYSKEFAAAISSSAASLAIILPPSIPMILYAVMAQQSVVQMFVAGLLPGFVGALGLASAACPGPEIPARGDRSSAPRRRRESAAACSSDPVSEGMSARMIGHARLLRRKRRVLLRGRRPDRRQMACGTICC
jgi:C4-dicarboxylate transporter, DctM subunit